MLNSVSSLPERVVLILLAFVPSLTYSVQTRLRKIISEARVGGPMNKGKGYNVFASIGELVDNVKLHILRF